MLFAGGGITSGFTTLRVYLFLWERFCSCTRELGPRVMDRLSMDEEKERSHCDLFVYLPWQH